MLLQVGKLLRLVLLLLRLLLVNDDGPTAPRDRNPPHPCHHHHHFQWHQHHRICRYHHHLLLLFIYPIQHHQPMDRLLFRINRLIQDHLKIQVCWVQVKKERFVDESINGRYGESYHGVVLLWILYGILSGKQG